MRALSIEELTAVSGGAGSRPATTPASPTQARRSSKSAKGIETATSAPGRKNAKANRGS